jgi:hypothetical protein
MEDPFGEFAADGLYKRCTQCEGQRAGQRAEGKGQRAEVEGKGERGKRRKREEGKGKSERRWAKASAFA